MNDIACNYNAYATVNDQSSCLGLDISTSTSCEFCDGNWNDGSGTVNTGSDTDDDGDCDLPDVSGYTVFDDLACVGENAWSSDGYTLSRCRAVCNYDPNCVSFEWHYDPLLHGALVNSGRCQTSHTCLNAENGAGTVAATNNDGVALYIKYNLVV